MSVAAAKYDVEHRLRFLWLEVTGRCNLRCVHCYSASGPEGDHGTMTGADWRKVIEEAATLGVESVQFIGGEPTLYPDLASLVRHALDCALGVEIYSNLARPLPPELWQLFALPGVRLATSYYAADAPAHELVTVGLPGRRVTVDSDEYTEWEELDVSSRPDLVGIYSTESVLRVLREALNRSSLGSVRVRCWANRYRKGERIAAHRDANGTIQLLICLKAPVSEASGGVLHLRTPLGIRCCSLAAGDGVLWEATAIEHWTTPLIATPEDAEPERLVLVGRYFGWVRLFSRDVMRPS